MEKRSRIIFIEKRECVFLKKGTYGGLKWGYNKKNYFGTHFINLNAIF